MKNLQEYSNQLEKWLNQECIYIESGKVMAVQFLGFEFTDELVKAHFQVTSKHAASINRVRYADTPLIRKWIDHPEENRFRIFDIATPSSSLGIINHKVDFSSSFGIRIRIFFIDEIVEKFKEKDMSWWDHMDFSRGLLQNNETSN